MTPALAAAILTGIAGIITALSVGFTRIIREMRPNGGESLRDRVNAIEKKLDALHLMLNEKPGQTTTPG